MWKIKEEKQQMRIVDWQYFKDPNEINKAIKNQYTNWGGITAENIISITYDNSHECYVVFWRYEE